MKDIYVVNGQEVDFVIKTWETMPLGSASNCDQVCAEDIGAYLFSLEAATQP